jgi:hypothetical protein
MYLDPGSTSLVIQALFAALATFFATYRRTRAWFAGLWARVARSFSRNRHRPDA